MHVRDPVPQRIHDELQGVGGAHVERVARSGGVEVVLLGVFDEPVVGGVVEAAESQSGAHVVALGRVVVDDVHDDFDVRLMEGLDHGLELVDLAAEPVGGSVAVVGGEEADGVVSPIVREALGLQRRVVDELVAGHELDGRDAQALEIVDDDGVRDSRIGSPDLLRNVRVRHGHAAHVRLVDDRVVVAVLWRAVMPPVEERVDDHRDHRVGRGIEFASLGRVVEIVGEERLLVGDLACDRLRVGVEKQFRVVAAQALGGIVGASHAESVALPGAHSWQIAMPHACVDFSQLDFGLVGGVVDEAQVDALGNGRKNGKIRPGAVVRGSEWV